MDYLLTDSLIDLEDPNPECAVLYEFYGYFCIFPVDLGTLEFYY
jgi:hypothetical protein